MIKRKVTVLISEDVADALHAASLAAGGYGQKSAIVERALRKELGLMMDRDYAIRTVNRLRAVRRDKGALSAQEQAEMGAALAALEGERLVWRAWLGDWMLGEGNTEEEAVAAAVAEYEKSVGYDEEVPSMGALISRLDVGISEE